MVSKKSGVTAIFLSIIIFLAVTCAGVFLGNWQNAWPEQQNISDPILREMASAALESGIAGSSELNDFIQKLGQKKDLATKGIVLNVDGSGGLLVIGFELKNDKHPKRWKHMIACWDNGKLQFQEIQPPHFKDRDFHYPFPSKAIAQKQGGQLEIGLVYDSAYGSQGGYKHPVFELWRKGRDAPWKCIWSSPNATCWRSIDGSLDFPEGNLNTIMVYGTGFGSGYAQDIIFLESHAGPHRVFQNTWVREGDEYVLTKWDVVQVTPYSVLTDFIYAISVDDNDLANSVSARPELLQIARDLGLVQKPLGLRWVIMAGYMNPIYVNSNEFYAQPTKERYDFDIYIPSKKSTQGDSRGASLLKARTSDKLKINVEVSRDAGDWKVSGLYLVP